MSIMFKIHVKRIYVFQLFIIMKCFIPRAGPAGADGAQGPPGPQGLYIKKII